MNGLNLTGTMTCSSILSFKVAAASATSVTCSWKNPAKGPYSGIIICAQTGSYPANKDTNRKYTGTGNNTTASGSSSCTITGLTQGTTYYFRAWAYTTCSAGNFYSGYSSATCATNAQGSKTFTASGTFTVPSNVNTIDVFCVGGGGGNTSKYRCGGGGGGYTAYKTKISVSAGTTYTVTIGAGGTAGTGGTTSFGSLVSATGGTSDTSSGGDGGSGGGSSMAAGHNANYFGLTGGSNGGNGGGLTDTSANKYKYAGIGQGTTTRAFGESSGTLYAGGGGGNNYSTYVGYAGGSGGGGKGAGTSYTDSSKRVPAVAGTANTGGGGGGGTFSQDGEGDDCYTQNGAAGGSGICIVRWGY